MDPRQPTTVSITLVALICGTSVAYPVGCGSPGHTSEDSGSTGELSSGSGGGASSAGTTHGGGSGGGDGDIPDEPGAYDVWTRVWCPESPNGGSGFAPVAKLEDLPPDPIGDGENNCYMAAFDTSRFSVDNVPVGGCGNLDLEKFPGHDCVQVGSGDELKAAVAGATKRVIVVTQDIEIGPGQLPRPGSKQTSVWIIGTYDPHTKRPILISQAPEETSTIFYWNSGAPQWHFTVLNLRIHANRLCFSLGHNQTTGTVTMQSVTGKCGERLLIYSFETPKNGPGGTDDPPSSIDDLTPWPLDDRLYMRDVMGRGGSSHSIYADRTYINWVERSIILASMASGKHAAKFEGQNVVLRNSIFTNTGIGNVPFDDSEWQDKWFYKGPRHGNLAPLSLASCSRVVLDHLTLFNHYDVHESNARAAQWQLRHLVGAGCDMPLGYYPNMAPTVPYMGPATYLGDTYATTPFWDDAFWDAIDENDPIFDPNMIVSYVTNIHVHQTDDGETNPDNKYAIGTAGTYPATKKGYFVPNFLFLDQVPAAWKERQRIVAANNCFDDGLLPDHGVQNYVPAGLNDPNDPNVHKFDNTDKFILSGSQACATAHSLDEEVRSNRDAFIDTLPPPPWSTW